MFKYPIHIQIEAQNERKWENYFYYFIMASLIPSIATIGAIVLTMHKRHNASKKQLIFKQVARNFESAIGYTACPLPNRP